MKVSDEWNTRNTFIYINSFLIQIRLSTGLIGTIEGPFGASGKTRIVLKESLKESEKKIIEEGGVKVLLKYIYMELYCLYSNYNIGISSCEEMVGWSIHDWIFTRKIRRRMKWESLKSLFVFICIWVIFHTCVH